MSGFLVAALARMFLARISELRSAVWAFE
jgi:hypothetical protein